MIPLINLLPWRALQRQRRLYCRAGITISVMLLLVSSFWGAGTAGRQKITLLKKQGDELETQNRKLQERLQHQQVRQQGEEQQQAGNTTEDVRINQISRWGNTLVALASQLPESSWLRAVTWQGGVTTLEGYTADMGDLERIDQLLARLPGHFHVKAGPVSYQAPFGLNYTFMLEDHGGELALP